jgi:hypothetical protein
LLDYTNYDIANLQSIVTDQGEADLVKWNIALALLVGATFSIVTIIPSSTPSYAASTKTHGDTGDGSGGGTGGGTMMGVTSFKPAINQQ